VLDDLIFVDDVLLAGGDEFIRPVLCLLVLVIYQFLNVDVQINLAL